MISEYDIIDRIYEIEAEGNATDDVMVSLYAVQTAIREIEGAENPFPGDLVEFKMKNQKEDGEVYWVKTSLDVNIIASVVENPKITHRPDGDHVTDTAVSTAVIMVHTHSYGIQTNLVFSDFNKNYIKWRKLFYLN